MERPDYSKAPLIVRAFDVYAMELFERFKDHQKTPDTCITAVTEAFIMGAGGHEGSFDAAMTLEYGGLAVLLESLGLSHIDASPTELLSQEQFEEKVRAAIDFGASWDLLEDEIPEDVVSDGEITGQLFGPLAQRYVIELDVPEDLDDGC